MSVGPRVALLAALAVVLLAAPATAGQTAPGLNATETPVDLTNATVDVTQAGLDAAQAQVENGDQANVTIIVDLQSNGDARWTVRTSFSLTTPAERAAFEELATSFEDGETSTLGLPAYRRASALATEATGREMEITDVQRSSSLSATLQNRTGSLALEFTWTNFGRTNDSRLEIGDVFRTEQGTWLSGLDAGDRLVIRAPDGYGIVDSAVAPQNRSLQWTGPQEFGNETLSATFTGQAGPTRTATPTQSGPTSGSTPWVVLFGVFVGGGVVAVYLFARRTDGIDLPGPAGGDADAESADDDAEAETDDEETGTPEPAITAESGTDESAITTGTEDDTESEDESTIDEALLSDEERVERLLEDNGGRMKQANIVKETGWSNAKVSQLLSSMEDEGRIDKLRIGRENLISFPDEEITDLDE